MVIPEKISHRIDLCKFPLIIGIIFIHSRVAMTSEELEHVNKYVYCIQILICDILSQVAVPLFFIISGYLFFIKFRSGLIPYLKTLRKKIFSLLIPYLLFNILTLAAFLIFQSIPQTSVLFNTDTFVSEYSIKELLTAISGIGGPSAAYHLWFIKHLIFLNIYAPVIYFILRKVPLPGLFFCAFLYFTDISLSWLSIDPKSLFFFYTGGFLAVTGVSLEATDSYAKMIVPLYMISAIGTALLIANGIVLPHPMQIVLIIFGVFAFWNLTDILAKNNFAARLITKGSIYYLFCYLAHQPLLNMIQKLLIRMFQPLNTLEITLIFFVTAFSAIGICLAIGYFLRRYLPGVFSVLVGGRI